jgi:carotenoid cleavage dioxygenase
LFVPRRPDTAEGDGWLLGLVYRGAEFRSDLAVFDTTDIAAGPQALVHLSHCVPAGVHGNSRPGAGPAGAGLSGRLKMRQG